MIDKDEYPQTAELEMRCVNILSRLWHAPDADAATGCSTQVVAQYYNFLRLGFEGYRRVQAYAREVATRLSGMIAQLGSFELLTRGDELPVFVHCPQ